MDKVGKSRRRWKIEDCIDASRRSLVAGVTYALVYGPLGCVY